MQDASDLAKLIRKAEMVVRWHGPGLARRGMFQDAYRDIEASVTGEVLQALLGTFEDVLINIQERGETRAAGQDLLTGVWRREPFDEAVRNALVMHNNHALPFCVAWCDVDTLILVNDMFGHQVGDDCVTRIAQTIISMAPRGSWVCRTSGEEFIMLTPGTTHDVLPALEGLSSSVRSLGLATGYAVQALEHAKRHQDVVDWRTQRLTETQGVTVSIGVTQLRVGDTVDTALSRAEEACYAAKTFPAGAVTAL